MIDKKSILGIPFGDFEEMFKRPEDNDNMRVHKIVVKDPKELADILKNFQMDLLNKKENTTPVHGCSGQCEECTQECEYNDLDDLDDPYDDDDDDDGEECLVFGCKADLTACKECAFYDPTKGGCCLDPEVFDRVKLRMAIDTFAKFVKDRKKFGEQTRAVLQETKAKLILELAKRYVEGDIEKRHDIIEALKRAGISISDFKAAIKEVQGDDDQSQKKAAQPKVPTKYEDDTAEPASDLTMAAGIPRRADTSNFKPVTVIYGGKIAKVLIDVTAPIALALSRIGVFNLSKVVINEITVNPEDFNTPIKDFLISCGDCGSEITFRLK